ncbi:hypothetical protein UPYG_G00033680 [Umbra pygmaea]|uniref:Torsin-1A-interacting protein 1/2 AAA+ activator domain-containing protein n=1 Tax=Umbra pygmaea TaxID=75934 RepID=A0ABD0YCD4_UMBPY
MVPILCSATMDLSSLPNDVAVRERRITRQTSKAVPFALTPRPPLKRSREKIKVLSAPVNGSKDMEDSSENDESPNKLRKSNLDQTRDGSGDVEKMDVEETDKRELGNQEPNEEGDFVTQRKQSPNKLRKSNIDQTRDKAGDVEKMDAEETDKHKHWNQEPNKEGDFVTQQKHDTSRFYDSSTKSTSQPEFLMTNRTPPDNREDILSRHRGTDVLSRRFGSSTKSGSQLRQPEVPTVKTSSMEEYKQNMMGKSQSTANHQNRRVYPTSEVPYISSQRVNSIPSRKQTTQFHKQEKPTVTKANPGKSYGGSIMTLCLIVLVVSGILGLLAFQSLSLPNRPSGDGEHPAWSGRKGEFGSQLSALEAMFPGQRSEMWRRSRIHLERHLRTVRPTEPVSIILTAGRRGEKTLRCLASRLASAFASARNASVLHIDGDKAGQDSDRVKLDIDSKLQGAFQGDKPVAVIHRFEELPPGSTLIFYRYCDHENAAYKEVFLAFTVLLPEEDLDKQLTLNEVEERVQDFIKFRFVGSDSRDNPSSYNRMDLDKLSGLWSRISHLILPVAAEDSIEQGGCLA